MDQLRLMLAQWPLRWFDLGSASHRPHCPFRGVDCAMNPVCWLNERHGWCLHQLYDGAFQILMSFVLCLLSFTTSFHSPSCLLPLSFVSCSDFLRTSFGAASEYIRTRSEQGPNERRVRVEREWNKSGTRLVWDLQNLTGTGFSESKNFRIRTEKLIIGSIKRAKYTYFESKCPSYNAKAIFLLNFSNWKTATYSVKYKIKDKTFGTYWGFFYLCITSNNEGFSKKEQRFRSSAGRAIHF